MAILLEMPRQVVIMNGIGLGKPVVIQHIIANRSTASQLMSSSFVDVD